MGMIEYRDTEVLVANRGFISALDVTSYPPNSSKMYKLVETGTTQSSLGMVLIS